MKENEILLKYKYIYVIKYIKINFKKIGEKNEKK